MDRDMRRFSSGKPRLYIHENEKSHKSQIQGSKRAVRVLRMFVVARPTSDGIRIDINCQTTFM